MMKKLVKIGAIIAGTLALGANAATDGILNHGDNTNITSEGTLDVLLNIDYVIQIDNLNDLDLGDFSSGVNQDMVGHDNFCVFTNAQSFSLRMFSNDNSGWLLADTNNVAPPIPYTVSLSSIDVSNQVNFLGNVPHDTTLSSLSETRNRKNCNMDNGVGGFTFKPNLRVSVTVDENDMLDAIPSSYKDTIMFVASPE